MYTNPISTGVVILGASEFDHFPDAGRQVFAKAAKRAREYFSDETFGLGVPKYNILNVFNSDLSAPEQKRHILDFVQEGDREGGRPTFTDVFVYIVSHGIRGDDHPLWIMVKSSQEHEDGTDDPDSYIQFKALFNGIMATSHCRVYFIVDTCFAGLVSQELTDEKEFSEEEIYADFRRDLMPKKGAALLMSNNRAAIGQVLADDESGLDGPMFSTILFDVLQEGKQDLYPYGFSFQTLKFLCIQRLETLVESGIDPLSTSFDVLDYRQDTGQGLSNAAVFQNNDPTRANRNAVARQIRNAYKEAHGAQRELKLAENRIVDLEMTIQSLAEHERELRKTNATLDEQIKLLNDDLDTAKAALEDQRTRAATWVSVSRLLAFVVLLSLPLAVLVMYLLEPDAVSGLWWALVG